MSSQEETSPLICVCAATVQVLDYRDPYNHNIIGPKPAPVATDFTICDHISVQVTPSQINTILKVELAEGREEIKHMAAVVLGVAAIVVFLTALSRLEAGGYKLTGSFVLLILASMAMLGGAITLNRWKLKPMTVKAFTNLSKKKIAIIKEAVLMKKAAELNVVFGWPELEEGHGCSNKGLLDWDYLVGYLQNCSPDEKDPSRYYRNGFVRRPWERSVSTEDMAASSKSCPVASRETAISVLPVERVECRKCHTSILKTTAKQHDGLCSLCAKKWWMKSWNR